MTKEYYYKHRDEYLVKKKQYRLINKEKISEQQRTFREANIEKVKGWKKSYFEKNRDKLLAYKKQYRLINKEKISEQQRTYREANKDRIKEKSKTYYLLNKARYKKLRKDYKETLPDAVIISRICESYKIEKKNISGEIIKIYRKRALLRKQFKSIQNETLSNS